MGKKMIGIIAVIVVLFVALFFALNYKNDQVLNDGNPYGKEDLKQSTIDLIGDPLYANQIVPEDLSEEITSGEATTVYYFSPECIYCVQTTPYLVPLTEEMDVEMKQYNVLEFPQEASPYGITATPTLVHYDNGEEVARLEGQYEESQYEEFFNEFVLSE